MIKRPTVVALLSLATGLLFALPAGADSAGPAPGVQRYGFEVGEPQVWNAGGTVPTGYTRKIDNTTGRTGTSSLLFSSPDATPNSSPNTWFTNRATGQTPATQVAASTQYTVSFYYQATNYVRGSTGLGGYLYLTSYAGTSGLDDTRFYVPAGDTGPGEWRRFSQVYTTKATADHLAVSLGFRGSTGTLRIDDVKVVPTALYIPESDASLSSIIVSGEALKSFTPATTQYQAVLAKGSTAVPLIAAVPAVAGATATIAAATDLSGRTTITVTSADQTEVQTYSVRFAVTDLDPAISYKKSAADFVHPGIFNTAADLRRMRVNSRAGYEPWKTAYKTLRTAGNASYYYQPAGPVEYVRTQADGHKLRNDANAVYNLAIMYNITRDQRYAAAARTIILAWAAEFKGFTFVQADLDAGGPNQKFPAAAEILRSEWSGWSQADTAALTTMFTSRGPEAIQDLLGVAKLNLENNHGTILTPGLMAIGIFTNNPNLYNAAVDRFYSPIVNPTYGGYQGGSLPANINPVTGQNKESERDQGHSQGNIAHLGGAAQIALSQGDPSLYEAYGNLVLKGFEFAARYNLGYDIAGWVTEYPWNTHGTTVASHNRGLVGMYEPVYNYYKNIARLPVTELPYTAKAVRATGNFPEAQAGDLPGIGTLIYSQPQERTRARPVPPKPYTPQPAQDEGYGRFYTSGFTAAGGRQALPSGQDGVPGIEPYGDRSVVNTTRLGNWLRYADFDFDSFGTNLKSVAMSTASNNNSGNLWIDLYADTDGSLDLGDGTATPTVAGGSYLGRVTLQATGTWTNYETFTAQLQNPPSGKHDLYLVVGGAEERNRTEFITNLNWLSFATSFATTSTDVDATLTDGQSLAYPNVGFDSGPQYLTATIKTQEAGGTLAIATDGVSLTQVALPDTKGADQEIRVLLSAPPIGAHDLSLTYTGPGVSLAKFRFFDSGSRSLDPRGYTAVVRGAGPGPDDIDGVPGILATDGAVIAYPLQAFGSGTASWSANINSVTSGTIELRSWTYDGTRTGQPVSQGEGKGNTGTLINTLHFGATDGNWRDVVSTIEPFIEDSLMVFLVVHLDDPAATVNIGAIHFDPTNAAPSIDPLVPISGRAKQQLTAIATGTDPDGDVLTFDAKSLPKGAALDSGTGVLSWTPTPGQAGKHTLTITASDGEYERSTPLTITITRAK